MKSRILFAAKFVFSGIFIAFVFFSFELRAEALNKTQTRPLVTGTTRTNFSIEADERRVFALVNRERERKGLSPLQWNSALARLARNYSEQMADEKFFSHYDRNGASVVKRAELLNIKGWRKIGENLFVCSGTSDFTGFAVQKWMKSPTHRQNILDMEWMESGIGIAKSDEGEIFITQVFTKN